MSDRARSRRRRSPFFVLGAPVFFDLVPPARSQAQNRPAEDPAQGLTNPGDREVLRMMSATSLAHSGPRPYRNRTVRPPNNGHSLDPGPPT